MTMHNKLIKVDEKVEKFFRELPLDRKDNISKEEHGLFGRVEVLERANKYDLDSVLNSIMSLNEVPYVARKFTNLNKQRREYIISIVIRQNGDFELRTYNDVTHTIELTICNAIRDNADSVNALTNRIRFAKSNYTKVGYTLFVENADSGDGVFELVPAEAEVDIVARTDEDLDSLEELDSLVE